MNFTSGECERQRFEHLVLGRPRPRAATPAGKRRGRRARPTEPVVLAPGIEERVALRERWSHKAHGTPETHEHADEVQRRSGSLARLLASGAIDKEQLAAAEQIVDAHRAITADVAVRTASWETRVHSGGRDAGIENLARVRAELTYGAWRRAVAGPIDALLDMIVGDVGVTIVARHHAMSTRRTRALLIAALDLWWVCLGASRTRPAG
jgi:hypothetical protein